MTAPRRATFDIACRGGTREQRTGYVLGAFATHKEPGPKVYSWTFTHLTTGVGVRAGWHERKAEALARLVELDRDGLPPHEEQILAVGTWGLGL